LVLVGVLRGIICQWLVFCADGQGWCVVMEIVVNIGCVVDVIVDLEKISIFIELI